LISGMPILRDRVTRLFRPANGFLLWPQIA
jgi:hypothetical protein